MNATQKKQILAKIVEQQKKLREFAEANGIDEAIVNMGATADVFELYGIMYPDDDENCNRVSRIWDISVKKIKLRELAEANEIDEAIVNMGATADVFELYEIMYPDDDEETEYMNEDMGECPKCDCLVKRKDLAWRIGYYLDICAECDKENQ